jgi:ribosomal protein S18 acetylase RimI-like enzyme
MTRAEGGVRASAIEIGPAGDGDHEWAARLMSASEPWITLGRGLEACRDACARPGLELFLAREGGAAVGFVLVHPRGLAGSPYVASIAVAPQARGQGVGRRLLGHVEDRFRPGARHLFLCVSSFNAAARRLYEREGFTAVGLLEDYVIDGAAEVLMHKWLRR